MEEKDYTKIIPEPPADLIEWIEKKKCLQKNYLIFKCNPDPKVLDVVCTACGEKFEAERLKDLEGAPCCNAAYSRQYSRYIGRAGNAHIEEGKKADCPYCGAPVTCAHSSWFTGSEWNKADIAWPLVISNVDGTVIAAGYRVTQTFGKDGSKKTRVEKYEAYIFEGKKTIRCTGFRRTFYSLSYIGHWEQRKRFTDEWHRGALVYYENNLFKKTAYKHCRMKEYMKRAGTDARPIEYLRLYGKHPQVENIVTQGLTYLLNKNTSSIGDGTFFNWKERSPRKILGLNKPDFEYVRSKKLSRLSIQRLKMLRELLPAERADVLEGIIDVFGYGLEDAIKKEVDILKLYNYLCRVVRRKEYTKQSDAWIDWKDYIDNARQLRYDLSDVNVKYPNNLKRAHDRAVVARKYKENKKLIQLFKDTSKTLAPLAWSNGTLDIRPARSEQELIVEGKILKHCVGGYGSAHCNGNPIFFIRATDNPDTPLFTLQLNLKDKRVIQNRGRNNCAPPQEVKNFVERWFREVVNKQEEKQKPAKRKTSAA